MSKKRKDTDYLCLSAQIRSMERNLLDRAAMERMLEAPSLEEAVRILTELGYESFDPQDPASMQHALLQRRLELFRQLDRYAPEPEIVNVFRLQYDYHNVKTLIKGGEEHLLVDAGCVDAQTLVRKHRDSGGWEFLPGPMAHAAAEAERVLAQTGDPQRSDALLDRAYFAQMLEMAQETRCAYLVDYVRTTIDAANLRSVIRTLRMGRTAAFLKEFLFPGGTISVDAVLHAAVNEQVEQLYRPTALRQAAQAGVEAVENGTGLTAFEKLCDDAVLRQAGKARRIPFGVEVVIGYVAAREAELTAVRIIISGRVAGLKSDAIRERLRESYV